MSLIYRIIFVSAALSFLVACNSVDRFSLLKKCTVLGDESIVYARAHYVKLFHHFNPEKFQDSYKQIGSFDAITHKNTIETYAKAINKFDTNSQEIKDPATQTLLSTCKNLAKFSSNFVQNIYPQAIKFKSKNDPLTDDFFIEINQMVKFDHEIGAFDKNDTSFKQSVGRYQSAVMEYIEQYRKNIPSEFVKQRALKSK